MRVKTVLMWLSLMLVISLSVQAQTSTNLQPRVLTSDDLQQLAKQGWDVSKYDGKPVYINRQPDGTYDIRSADQPQTNQVTLSPTPPDLQNAVVSLDSFLGMTNATFPADVIGMNPNSLKFRINGQDYDYSGNYMVMLNTPRQHKNPYFGLGSPETVKLLILENYGGWPLQNATIWDKKSNFIDAIAVNKEWIYSGSYTIQK